MPLPKVNVKQETPPLGSPNPMVSTTPCQETSESELLGSLTTQQQQRTSARVIKKLRLDNEADTVEKKEPQECVGEKETPLPGMEKCDKDAAHAVKKRINWSTVEKSLFFDAINEHGKDFDAMTSYINSKLKKKGSTGTAEKTKMQVAHFYYRTWHKLSKYLHFDDSVKKVAQELYTLINYGEMRKKLVTMDKEKNLPLFEMICNGVATVKAKGRNFRVRTPMCRALRRLNRLTDDSAEARVPCRVVVRCVARNTDAWARVQAAAQNPRLSIHVAPRVQLHTVLHALEARWSGRRSSDSDHFDEKKETDELNQSQDEIYAKTDSACIGASSNSDDTEIRQEDLDCNKNISSNYLNLPSDRLVTLESSANNIRLHLGPRTPTLLHLPTVSISRASRDISYLAYLQREGLSKEGSGSVKIKTPKRHRKDSTTDRDGDSKKVKIDYDDGPSKLIDIDEAAIDGIELMASLNESKLAAELKTSENDDSNQMTDKEMDLDKSGLDFDCGHENSGDKVVTDEENIPDKEKNERFFSDDNTKVELCKDFNDKDKNYDTENEENVTEKDKCSVEVEEYVSEKDKCDREKDKFTDKDKQDVEIDKNLIEIEIEGKEISEKNAVDKDKDSFTETDDSDDDPPPKPKKKVQKFNNLKVKFRTFSRKRSYTLPTTSTDSAKPNISDETPVRSSTWDRDLVVRQSMRGWSVTDAGHLTIGDLYLMFGHNSKLDLEYWWSEATPPLPANVLEQIRHRCLGESEKSSPPDKQDEKQAKYHFDLEDDKRESDTDILSPRNTFSQDSNDGASGDEKKVEASSPEHKQTRYELNYTAPLKVASKVINNPNPSLPFVQIVEGYYGLQSSTDVIPSREQVVTVTSRLQRLISLANLYSQSSNVRRASGGVPVVEELHQRESNAFVAPSAPSSVQGVKPARLKTVRLEELARWSRRKAQGAAHTQVVRRPLVPTIDTTSNSGDNQSKKSSSSIPAGKLGAVPDGVYMMKKINDKFYILSGDKNLPIELNHAKVNTSESGTSELETDKVGSDKVSMKSGSGITHFLDNISLPSIEVGSVGGNDDQNSGMSAWMSPSRLLRGGNEAGTWMDTTDCSLSSLLNQLERNKPPADMETQVECMMAESSNDFITKFADLAAEVESDNKE